MNPKHEKLIDDLLRKTAAGEVEWEQTDAAHQFALKLKRGAILIEKSFELFSYGNFTITLLNNEGKQIDRFDTIGEQYRGVVQELYEIIDRRVSRVDEQIDEIIGELEAL